MNGTGKKMMIYHMYGGTMVMDEGWGLAQLRHHYQGDAKFENDIVAATYEPLSDRTLKQYMAQYQITYDPTKRGPLKEFTETARPRPLRG